MLCDLIDISSTTTPMSLEKYDLRHLLYYIWWWRSLFHLHNSACTACLLDAETRDHLVPYLVVWTHSVWFFSYVFLFPDFHGPETWEDWMVGPVMLLYGSISQLLTLNHDPFFRHRIQWHGNIKQEEDPDGKRGNIWWRMSFGVQTRRQYAVCN